MLQIDVMLTSKSCIRHEMKSCTNQQILPSCILTTNVWKDYCSNVNASCLVMPYTGKTTKSSSSVLRSSLRCLILLMYNSFHYFHYSHFFEIGIRISLKSSWHHSADTENFISIFGLLFVFDECDLKSLSLFLINIWLPIHSNQEKNDLNIRIKY